MRLVRRLDVLRVVALILVGLALAAAIAWAGSDAGWVEALAPNIITESIGIALVLTVIDWALRRRDRRRVQPLVDYTFGTIGLGFLNFVTSLVLDYSTTHVYPRGPAPTGGRDARALARSGAGRER